MLTGLEPPEHGVRDNGLFRLDPAHRTVGELLPSGTPTAAFVGAFPLRRRFGLDQGFSAYDDALPRAEEGGRTPERRASEVFASAATWILAQTAERSFAWVHVYDPHYSYTPPEPWNRVGNSRDFAGAFETEVAYTDHSLGRFLREIDAWRADRGATVLLVADHGEALGDHKEPTHGLFIYDSTQRVPMVLAGPGIEPRLVSTMRGLVDVAPTLLDLFGVEAPPSWRGRSLRREHDPEWMYMETLSTELLRGWSALYGVRTERWKYIRAPRPELYDLEQDPAERVNILSTRAGTADSLAQKLEGILAAAPSTPAPEADNATMEQLRSLGYVAQIEPGSRRTSGKDPKDQIEVAAALFQGEQAYLDADFPRAESFLRRALQRDPDCKEAHAFLSGTYFGLGRYAPAVEHARRALQLQPHLNEGPLHMTIGEAYLAMGRAEDARVALEEALRQMPKSEKARALLARASSTASGTP